MILVEGIFLFKQAYRSLFDLAIWVDCSLPTALARALERSQEGLPPAKTIAAYGATYFPAQEIHFNKDNPRAAADLIYDNDPYAIEHCSLASSQPKAQRFQVVALAS